MSFTQSIAIEFIAAASALVFASLALVSGPLRAIGAWALAALVGGAGLIALAGMSLVTSDRDVARETLASAVPVLPESGRPEDEYVGSDACIACHPGEHASWHRSFHRTMTQIAAPDTVIGDFDEVRLAFDGRDVRLFERDDEYWIEAPDPDWELAEVQRGRDPDAAAAPPRSAKRVVMTTGFHHYQAYWVASVSKPRLLINFPFVWLRDQQRWVPREAAFLRPPDAQRLFQVWNNNCVHCHAVEGEELIDYASGDINTTAVELGIACESCHGPGAKHIAANRDPVRRYSQQRSLAPDDTIVQPALLSPMRSSEVCGQCHSITMPKPQAEARGLRYRPGDVLGDFKEVVRATDQNLSTEEAREHYRAHRRFVEAQNPEYYVGRYWSDGMPRVSGREYSSQLESPCYQTGELSCLHCHSMHDYVDAGDQLHPEHRGNAACVQCHEEIGADLAAHTHHDPGSPGSECMNCHMPHTTFGLVKAIRSHTVESPSAATVLETGRPDGCSLCHLDQPLAWTAHHLADWYGQAIPHLDDDDTTTAAGARWLLEGDAGQRALVAWHGGWAPAHEASGRSWLVPYLGQLLDDPYAVVRSIAERSLRSIEGYDDLVYDYVGAGEHRTSIASRILAEWSLKDAVADYQSVLLNDDGTLDERAFRSRLARRDDRPMDLQE